MSTIKLEINGAEKEFPANSTIKEVLENINIKSNMIVVELNLEIIQKDQYDKKILNDKDKLEIVGFFGGG